MHKKYEVAASGENLHKVVLNDKKRTINFLTQEVEKLKLSHKNTVERLQLELSQVKVAIAPEDAVSWVLQREPGTPLVSGGFESPTMASTDARSDPVRGSAHILTMGARVRVQTLAQTVIARKTVYLQGLR
jgi:hypothetical protein